MRGWEPPTSWRQSGLIRSIKDIRSEEMALGLQWQGNGHQAALTFRAPMRVANAEASLRVPVGRTQDGRVIREDREVSLAPSGRQRDIEVGYALSPTDTSRVQLNVMYSIEPGHDRRASNTASAMVNYTQAF